MPIMKHSRFGIGLLIFLFTVSLGANLTAAQSSADITFFIDNDTLTIYTPSGDIDPLDLMDFQVQEGTNTHYYSFAGYFNYLAAREGPAPVCFRIMPIRYKLLPPSVCPKNAILNAEIYPEERFWYDDVRGFRRDFTLIWWYATPLLECQAGENECVLTSYDTPLRRNMDWQPVMETVNGIPVVQVPAGCFLMGSTEAQIAQARQFGESARPVYVEEEPASRQCFDQPYWIGMTEVTNAQYSACVSAEVCSRPDGSLAFDDPAYADYPVTYVTWDQAQTFAAWWGGRLSTESEWEYAARGVNARLFPYGDIFVPSGGNFCDEANCGGVANTDDGYAGISPAGAFPVGASWVGALDMSGNVWEWVSSMYWPYPYNPDDGRENPNGDANTLRVLRGGSLSKFTLNSLRGSERNYSPAGVLPYPQEIGFRVALDEV